MIFATICSFDLRLELKNITHEDVGTYFCNVTNMVSIPSSLTNIITQSASAQLRLHRKFPLNTTYTYTFFLIEGIFFHTL